MGWEESGSVDWLVDEINMYNGNRMGWFRDGVMLKGGGGVLSGGMVSGLMVS